MTLAWVPLAVIRAASFPSSFAISFYSLLVVGQSMYISSPTTELAMASRILSQGRVTVSDLRSM